MRKVSFVFGTRPEAIKLAPLIKLFKQRHDIVTEICTTGQHKEMLYQVLDLFQINPDVDLKLMTHNQSLPEFLANSIKELNEHFLKSKPDLLFVQGDTSTVLAAAMAAFYHKIKVFHVEAGLRTDSLYSPYPEEMNRRLTTQLSEIHFAPTARAKENLLKGGVCESKILVTGNTSIDGLLDIVSAINNGKLKPEISESISNVLKKYSGCVLITGHRRENFGTGFKQICSAITKLAEKHPDVLFIYPVHLNPNVKEVVFEKLSHLDNVLLIPPQGYLEFVYLMMNASIILTDSGGIQEEGPSLGKPILVMRESTERPEGVEAGCSVLVGTDETKIVNEVSRLLTDKVYYDNFSLSINPYGDGFAAKRIFEFTINLLGLN